MFSSPMYDSRAVDPPGRDSTAAYVAGKLRAEISDGSRAPGDKLSEAELRAHYDVSRNTLREAFQLLTRERLVVHHLNRGFNVRRPTVDDLTDIYRARRAVECGALFAGFPGSAGLERIGRAVAAGESAAARGDGRAVGSANIQFHRAIAALAMSARVDAVMDQILAELRLAFHVMGNMGDFHLPYLARNREIYQAVSNADITGASTLMWRYLDDAEHQLQDAYEAAKV